MADEHSDYWIGAWQGNNGIDDGSSDPADDNALISSPSAFGGLSQGLHTSLSPLLAPSPLVVGAQQFSAPELQTLVSTAPIGQVAAPKFAIDTLSSMQGDASSISQLSALTNAPLVTPNSTGFHLNLVYDAQALAAPQSFRDSMQAAANILEATITNFITVNISVGYGEIDGTPIGPNVSEGGGGGINVNYSTLRSYLAASASSSTDNTALSFLPNTSSLDGTSQFVVMPAQQKVFGIMAPDATGIDGEVGMGTGFTGNVLIAGALHEITHAMGRIAGFSLDIYRFNEDHSGHHVFGFAIPATPSYFSIDGGTTDLADFGINSDPGDWLNNSLTPNDPFDEFVGGNAAALTSQDLTVMDVLGFSLTPPPPGDLTVPSVSFDGKTITFTLLNSGSGPADTTNTGIFLSSDTSITNSDHLVATVSSPVLAKNASVVESAIPSLPTDFLVSTYYLGVIANYDGGVTESNSTNDTSNAVPFILGNDDSNSIGGTSGNDIIIAQGGNDTVTPGTGTDFVNTGSGDDTIDFSGGQLIAGDKIDGDTGNDTVILNSDYTSGNALIFGTTTMMNVENLRLLAGHSYSLTTNDATVASGQTLNVDASSLGSSNVLAFNGGAESNGVFTIAGGSGNDNITAGAGADTIWPGTGTDTVNAAGGNDYISFSGGQLIAGDHIDGSSGNDTVFLNSDYTGGNALTFNTATMINVENLTLGAGHSYNLTTNDGTVAAGQTLNVNANFLANTDTFTFNGSAETNGTFAISGGPGNDNITAGAGADTIWPGTGTDTVNAGGGNDYISFSGGQLIAGDHIDGGSGNDTVYLNSNYTGGNAVVFNATTMVNVETLTLAPGNSYSLTTNDGTVASGQTLTLDGSALGSSNSVSFDGSAETNGTFILKGGAGADTLIGGAGNDTLYGGPGNDVLNGGVGSDSLDFSSDTAGVYADLGAGFATGASMGTDTLISIENVTGGSGDDQIAGNSSNNVLIGSAGNDTIWPGTGTDTVNAGSGNDYISFSGGQLIAADQIDGGVGTDTVYLNSDYTGGNALTFGSTTMLNVENLTLAAGHSYNLTTNDATVASGQTLNVNANFLGISDTFTFNGSAESNGTFAISGGPGNDNITAGVGADTIWPGTGTDTVNAGGGNDYISFSGGQLIAGDHIDGGSGTDTVYLNGNYTAGNAVVFNATTLVNVETLTLAPGNNYKLTTNDGTVASGQTLTLDGSGLGSSNSVNFDGSAETNGTFILKGGAGADTLIGGAGNDSLYGGPGNDVLNGGGGTDSLDFSNDTAGVYADLGAGFATSAAIGNDTLISIENVTGGSGSDQLAGNSSNNVLTGGAGNDTIWPGTGTDTVNAGSGDDTISFTAGQLIAADQIDGGVGNDTVYLNSDYTGGNALTFGASTMVNVENLTLAAGHNYNLTTNDGTVAFGQTLNVNANFLGTSDTFTFNGSAESNGTFAISGGPGNDNITAGAGADTIWPGTGTDTVNAGGGNDYISFSGGQLIAGDHIDGGSGNDTVYLNGNYTGGNAVVFNATTMVNVETLTLAPGNNYSLTTNEGTVALGQILTLDASALGPSNSVNFDGSAETDGTFILKGGAGADTLIGGGGNDTLFGGPGNDVLNGGGGINTFDFSSDTAGVYADLGAGFATSAAIGTDTLIGIQNVTGGSGDDQIAGNSDYNVLLGGAGNDTIWPGTGIDTVNAGSGDDYISFTAGQLIAFDEIDGSSGNDTVFLNSDYTGGNALTFRPTTMVNVENLTLGAGHSYNLTTDDGTVASGQTLNVNANFLGTSDTFTFNGSAETNGTFAISGGPGNDNITAGAGADTIWPGTGTDTVNAGGGNDYISFSGGQLIAGDHIDGGSGTDTVYLNGDYIGANALTFGASTITNVEILQLAPGHSYSLISNDGIVASGQTLTVNGTALGSADSLSFNGARETDGSLALFGGSGADALTGGSGNDSLNGGDGNDLLRPGTGSDTVNAGAGDDTISFVGGQLIAADHIDGGTGNDTVVLDGDYTGANAVTFNGATMANVEQLSFGAGSSYSITTNDATVAAGKTMTVNASSLLASDTLTFNGSAETDGAFVIIGGNGADNLTTGASSDTFIYTSAAQSTSSHYDTITGFNYAFDRFDIPGASNPIGAIDPAVVGGSLSVATFDSDLSAALSGLGADHAVLFRPGTGNLAGSTFLVVDLNGSTGYQSGSDLVFHMVNTVGTLATGDFT